MDNMKESMDNMKISFLYKQRVPESTSHSHSALNASIGWSFDAFAAG